MATIWAIDKFRFISDDTEGKDMKRYVSVDSELTES